MIWVHGKWQMWPWWAGAKPLGWDGGGSSCFVWCVVQRRCIPRVNKKLYHDPRVQQKTLFVYSGLLFVQQIKIPNGEFICVTKEKFTDTQIKNWLF
jgi:hypothetical protein